MPVVPPSPDEADAPDSPCRLYKPEFIPPLIPNPKDPRPLEFLIGYWGDSSEHGYERLYFDPFLQDYLDIPRTAVLASIRMPIDRSPLGGSYVWIDAASPVLTGRVGGARLLGTVQQGLQWLRAQSAATSAAAFIRAGVEPGVAPHPPAPGLGGEQLEAHLARLEAALVAPPPPPPPPPPAPTVTESRSGVTTRNPYC